MSKGSGLGDRYLVGGYDLSGDTSDFKRIAGGPMALEDTGIDKSAPERIGGVRDGGIDWTSYFNKAADQAHLRLSPLPRTDTIVTYLRGTVLGNAAAALNAKQVNYDGKRDKGGMLTFDVSSVANGYGLEWCKQVTAGLRTDTSATNGTGVDFGTGSTTFGLQAYVQVTVFDGTDVTIKLQESSDNGAGDAFADVTGGSFGALTAVGAARIETARGQTVERYLRAVTTTSGGFNSVTFSVVVARNDTSVVF